MPQPQNVIGIDIGGTKILAGRFDVNNLDTPTETIKTPTEAEKGYENVLENLSAVIKKLRNNNTKSVGISWAGFVDTQNGIIKTAPNIPGFDDFPLAKFLSKNAGLPVFVENDAKLFSIAEQKESTENPKVFLGIILGTGVGSGIVLNGKIFTGHQNFAGEIGHQITTDPSTGKNVSIESLLAGPGLQKFLGEPLQDIEEKMENDPEFKKQVQKKMEPRIEVAAQWIHNLIFFLNPQKIVLGGGAGQNFWQLFLPQVRDKISEKINAKNHPITFDLQTAKLENAGLIGAAILAHKKSL